MKIYKPTVTKAQAELQIYVEGLLLDCSQKLLQKPLQEPLQESTQKETEKTNKKNENFNQPLPRTENKPLPLVAQTSKQNVPQFKQKLEPDLRLQGVEQLLAKIALADLSSPKKQSQKETKKLTSDSASSLSSVEIKKVTETTARIAQDSFTIRKKQPLKRILGNVFQTLVFDVGKLPLAVPLVKLGGIAKLNQDEITPLVGTPKWFMGLLPNERGNLMVVDTQKFLMPELGCKEQASYQYLIILDDSLWALACHSVGDAKNLQPEDIRWASPSTKRPWFAGMVVEYMSALLEVDGLINLLAKNVVD